MHSPQNRQHRYRPFVCEDHRLLLLEQGCTPYAPTGRKLLQAVQRLYAECSAKGHMGFVPKARATQILCHVWGAPGTPLNLQAGSHRRIMKNGLAALHHLGQASLVGERLALPHFAVGHPDTGLLYAADMRAKHQKAKRQRNAKLAKARSVTALRLAADAFKPDLRCIKTQNFRMCRVNFKGGLHYLPPSGDLSRAAFAPRKEAPSAVPNPTRVIIRGGIKQPDRRPSALRCPVLGDVEQTHLLSRQKAKGYTVLGRKWAITDRHRANVAYAASLASQPETQVHNLPQPHTSTGPASPPAHKTPQPARTLAGADACLSHARQPRMDKALSASGGVQTPNTPKTQGADELAARLERLTQMDDAQLADMDADGLWVTPEQYTIEQAQADAHDDGFGAARPATPRVGTMPTEPVGRGLHLTPQFGEQLHRAYPWTAKVPLQVLARVGGTQATVTAAVLNMQRRPDLGPGALVSCVQKMATGAWGLPVHLMDGMHRAMGRSG